jgi:hypothetical protein
VGVPTGEVALDGARAWLAGNTGGAATDAARDGKGINRMMEMVNGSRFGVALFGGNGYMNDWPMARQLRDAQCHTIWEGTENILCIDVRRAMRGEGAHHALLGRITRALDAASSHKVLATAVDSVAAARDEAAAAIAHLESVDDDLALLHSRRMAELLADTAEAALLLDEAAWALERDGDARKAAVARRFAWRRLAEAPARGIFDTDRTVLDHFDGIVRYGRIEPDQLAA